MTKSNKALVIIVIIILAILVLGLIGSSQSEKIGTTCDFGIGKDDMTGETGSTFCWKWHRNVIGQVGDDLNSIFGK